MKITNKTGLPDSFLNFARDDKYTKGNADISVTTLIDSPRVRIMRDVHADKLETDVVDMIWPLFGTAVHHILESSKSTNEITIEERLFGQALGWTLSGAIDHQELLEDGTVRITDYKVTSAWSVILGKDEWALQQNCYAWLVKNSIDGKNRGRDVSSLRICAILRDWQRKKAMFDKDYPQAPIVTVELPLWSGKKIDNYIHERITDHQDAQIMYDTEDRLPLCSPSEMWAKPDTFAVKEKGKVRAKRVLNSEEEAIEYIGDNKNLAIEFRKGERTRCEGYCSVSEYCDQFTTWRKT